MGRQSNNEVIPLATLGSLCASMTNTVQDKELIK